MVPSSPLEVWEIPARAETTNAVLEPHHRGAEVGHDNPLGMRFTKSRIDLSSSIKAHDSIPEKRFVNPGVDSGTTSEIGLSNNFPLPARKPNPLLPESGRRFLFGNPVIVLLKTTGQQAFQSDVSIVICLKDVVVSEFISPLHDCREA